MKKTYTSPAIRIVKLNTAHSILNISGPKVVDTAADQNYNMDARSDNSWDIWGNNED